MPEIGQSSRTIEEEVIVNIHVNTKQPVVAEFEVDPEEDQVDESEEKLPPEDHMIKQLADRNLVLEDRVKHLEMQNQIHLVREDQYEELAYPLEVISGELIDGAALKVVLLEEVVEDELMVPRN